MLMNLSIRWKILLSLITIICALFLLLCLTAKAILSNSFAHLEKQDTQQQVERVSNALSDDLADLSATVGDWSPWDDTVAFVAGDYDEYVASNLTDITFVNLELNFMLFSDASGQIVFGKGFDLQTKREIPLPDSLKAQVAPGSLLTSHADVTSQVTGLMLLPEGVLLVASRPILNSQARGPVEGTLIMGCFLSQTQIDRLSESTKLTLSIEQIDAPTLPDDFQLARSALLAEDSVFIQPLNEDTVAGYTIVKDIYGKPILLLRVSMPRTIYKQGQTTLALYFWSLLLGSLVFSLLMIALLESQILSRLTRLSHKVKAIGTQQDTSARLPVTGSDEISSLAHEINITLDALERSRKMLAKNDERFQELITSISDHVYMTLVSPDGNKRNLYLSPNIEPLTGYPLEDFSANWNFWASKVIHPDDQTATAGQVQRLMVGQNSEIEYRLVRADGAVIWVRDSGRVVNNRDGSRTIYGVVSEITARKEAEEALRESERQYKTLFDSAPAFIFAKDRDSRYTSANLQVLEYSDQNPVGFTDVELHSPEVAAKLRRHDLHVIETGQELMHEEDLPTPHGLRQVLMRKVPLLNSHDERVGVLGIGVDITAHKLAEEQLKLRVFQQATVSHLGQIALATEDLATLFDTAVEFVTATLKVEYSSVLELQPTGDQLVLRRGIGWPEAYMGELVIQIQENSLAGYTLMKDEPVIYENLHTETRFTPSPLFYEHNIVSGLSVIIYNQTKPFGILGVHTTQGRVFNQDDVHFVQAVANVLALAIQRRQMEDALEEHQAELRRRNQELILLNRIIAASVASQEPEDVLQVVCREFVSAFNLSEATATLITEDRTAAKVVAEFSESDRPSVLNRVIPLERTPAVQQFLARKTPLVVADAQQDPSLEPFHKLICSHGISTLLILPLIINDEVIGSFNLITTEPRVFSTEEINLACRAADQISGALARVRLDQARRLLSIAVEQSADMVMITDTNGIIIYVNQAFERISGFSRGEAMGQTHHLFKSGQHTQPFYQDLWATLSAGKIWHKHLVNKKKDGSLYTLDAILMPVHDGAGQIINYVALQRDITHELALEDQLRQAQKMEAMGRLASGVAHDFNNNLTVIAGHTELLLHRHLAPDAPYREEVEEILKACLQAATLTKQLLVFSRQQPLQPQVMNLNQIVNNVHKMLCRLIGEHITLTTNLSPGLGLTEVDSGQIEQILMNLCINARDAMSGDGQITIQTTNIQQSKVYPNGHSGMTPGAYVLLSVSDTGHGMDSDTKGRIFEPFFTTKSEGKGTGLGLSTVYGIVEQSGGYIQVDSVQGEGTTFRIYFPRTDRQKTLAETHLPKPIIDVTGQELILLVEDEASIRQITRKLLQAQGYTVLEAGHAEDALQLVQQYEQPIDLLITDVIMPQMDGPELAEHLLKHYPRLRVLYISGYAKDILDEYNVQDSNKILISKPFSSDTLAYKVREILDLEKAGVM